MARTLAAPPRTFPINAPDACLTPGTIMSYVQEVLQPGETVKFRTNVHWSGYFKAIVALIVGLCVLIWFWRDGGQNMILLLAGLCFGIAAVGLAVPTSISRFGTEIAVTDRRLIS